MGNNIPFIDSAHERIHAGKHFVVSGQDTLNSSATKIFLLTTADNEERAHLKMTCRSTGEANVAIYENPTVSNVGTGLTEINRNRNLAATKTPGMSVTHTPTTSDNGTLIYTEHFGAGQKGGGESRNEAEFVLKTNEQYLIVITSEANANDISHILDWYESR